MPSQNGASHYSYIMFAMVQFSSKRERHLWFWAIAVIVAIYATLGLARSLSRILGDVGLPEITFVVGMLLVLSAIIVYGLRVRPGRHEIFVALGVIAAYLLMFARMSTAAERTHVMEYGIVAILVHAALTERASNGFPVPAPAFLAVAITGSLGVLDESVQYFLPSRVFDLRDMLVNVLASAMAIVAVTALGWARRKWNPRG